MRKNYILALSIITSLLIVSIGFTFAYFTSGINVGGDGSNITIDTERDFIKVTYDAGSSTLTGKLMPGDTLSKDFTITVTPTAKEKTAIYAIYMNINENTFVKCTESNYDNLYNACTLNAKELTYTIKDDTNTILATGDFTGKNGKVKLLAESKTVDVETTFSYTLEITFNTTNASQNHNQNKSFNGDVIVEFAFLETEDILASNKEATTYDEAGNLRYVGSDPSNYVYFNCNDYASPTSDTCELWRIIGVFDEDTHGINNTRLIKLIRNDAINSYPWDTKPSGIGSSTSRYGSNNWSDSRLMMLLNPGYETITNSDIYGYEGSLYYNASNGTCYSGLNDTTESCDFTTSGLKNDITRNMIEKVIWKLGGASSSSTTAYEFYNSERGESVPNDHDITWSGKIGLIYPSDYGYATSGGTNITREACLGISLSDYNSYSDCYNNNWLFNNSSQSMWTLTPVLTSTTNVYYTFYDGRMFNGYVYFGSGIHPTIYLKANVAISGGIGTQDAPYTLSTS